MAIPSPSYERNRDPILAVLQRVLMPSVKRLFEVGSGSGHHAVYLAPHFPFLRWLTSEVSSQVPVVADTLSEAAVSNVEGPISFEVGVDELPAGIDAVFSANTLHIMSEAQVQILIQLLAKLPVGALVLFYGPFNYQGQFTSESNAAFEQWLKATDPQRGIRDFEKICQWMEAAGFVLQNDFAMPSNNRILHFAKVL